MIYFLLCAYNEEKNIVSVIKNIRQQVRVDYKIIIVNDGSTDGTKQKIEENKDNDIILINHNKNLGLGVALKTGLSFLSNVITKKDAVITLDADNTHPVMLSNIMVENFSKGYDIVIASRYCRGSAQYGVPLYRKFISYTALVIFKIVFPYKGIKDYTSGYRLYSGSILRKLFGYYKENFITQQNFVAQVELLVKLLRFKPHVCEIPLKLEYFKKYGKSKLKIIKNITSYLNWILSVKFLNKL